MTKIKQLFNIENTDLLLKQILVAVAVILIGNFAVISFADFNLLIFVDLAVMVFLFCLKFIRAAFYAMVFLFPFIGWQIVVGKFNAPLIDWLAIVIFFAWVFRFLADVFRGKKVEAKLPGLIFAGFFFLTGVLSLVNVEFLNVSVKYLIRPLVFFYLMFIVLPYNLITDKKQLKKVLKVMIVAGLIVAFLGFLSMIFTAESNTLRRAQPFVMSDFDPIGGNQNAVAETIVVTMPLVLFLLASARSYQRQASLLIALAFLMIILLFTFSRSGYLALMLQIIILFLVNISKKFDKKVLIAIILAFIVLPTLFYMSVWQEVSWVRSSNLNRIVLTEIAWDAFSQNPILGSGPGTFQNIVGQTFVFIVDFGDPLDSHGFVQKVMVEQGALGLIAFVSFLVYLFAVFLRSYFNEEDKEARFKKLCLFLMLAGIILFELFSTSYYLSRVWFPIGVGLAALRLYDDKKELKIRIK